MLASLAVSALSALFTWLFGRSGITTVFFAILFCALMGLPAYLVDRHFPLSLAETLMLAGLPSAIFLMTSYLPIFRRWAKRLHGSLCHYRIGAGRLLWLAWYAGTGAFAMAFYHH